MARIDDMIQRLPHWWSIHEGSATYGWMLSVAQELDLFDVQSANLQLSVFISTAIGTELEDLGALFRLGRLPGEPDANYRARIQAARSAFLASGTIPGLTLAFTATTGLPDTNIVITETFPTDPLKVLAEMTFTIDTIDLIQTAINSVQNAKAAGVYLTTQLNFGLAEDDILVADQVSITTPGPGTSFILDVSSYDGADMFG